MDEGAQVRLQQVWIDRDAWRETERCRRVLERWVVYRGSGRWWGRRHSSVFVVVVVFLVAAAVMMILMFFVVEMLVG